MTFVQLLRTFFIRGLIAAAIASAIGVGYAFFTHNPVTNVTISTANLLIFIAMIVLAGLNGNIDTQDPQIKASSAILNTSHGNSKDDFDHTESSVSFTLKLAGSSIIPLLVWAIAYFGF